VAFLYVPEQCHGHFSTILIHMFLYLPEQCHGWFCTILVILETILCVGMQSSFMQIFVTFQNSVMVISLHTETNLVVCKQFTVHGNCLNIPEQCHGHIFIIPFYPRFMKLYGKMKIYQKPVWCYY